MKRITKLMTEHPASVNETYWQHMGVAFYFGTRMFAASIACMLHGIFPFLFTRTGSQTVTHLHDRMVANRTRHTPPHATAAE